MEIFITRYKQNNIGTWGKLMCIENGVRVYSCYTFEPVGNDTTARGLDRRVPQGLYDMRWHNSPRFKTILPHIYNSQVPLDRYILIHAGNLPDHTEGCILLGTKVDEKGIWDSRKAVSNFINLLSSRYRDKLTCKLNIVNRFE